MDREARCRAEKVGRTETNTVRSRFYVEAEEQNEKPETHGGRINSRQMAGQLDEKGGGIQKCKWPVLETVPGA